MCIVKDCEAEMQEGITLQLKSFMVGEHRLNHEYSREFKDLPIIQRDLE